MNNPDISYIDTLLLPQEGTFEDRAIKDCEQDYILLLVLIIIESYQKKNNILYLNSLYKTEYWNNRPFYPIINNEKLDDGPMPTKIFMSPFKCFSLAHIQTISIANIKPSSIIQLIKQYESKDSKKPFFHPNFYAQALNYTNNVLSKIERPMGINDFIILENAFPQHYKFMISMIPYLYFLSKLISFELIFDAYHIKKTNEIINIAMKYFANNKYYTSHFFPNKKPFNTQIKYFHKFINALPINQNIKQIPLNTLNEPKFEIVKILKYLEINKIISVDSWDETKYWKITFHKDPQDQATYFPSPEPKPHEFRSVIIAKIDTEGKIFKNNSKLSHPLGKNNRLYTIIKFLANKKEYIKTEIISKKAPPPNSRKTNELQVSQDKNKCTREAIGKINKLFKEKLKIDNFIIGKQRIGYKINDNYQITVG